MRRTIVAAGAVVVLASGCGAQPTTTATEPTESVTPSGTVTPSETASAVPTDADRALVRAFAALAADPGPDTVAAVPFAPEVALGLGGHLLPAVSRERLSVRSAWSIDADLFRGYVGPFNALEHAAGRLDVSVGAHPHCAGPPEPAPAGLADLRRVSLQPAAGTIDSCIDWSSVDLFLDGDRVVAVTLDLWEP